MTFTSPKTVLLIRNPTAGRRRRGLVDAVVRHLRAAGWRVDLVDTAAAGDARRIAETCDASSYAVIAVAGGDGTINEVVNGLARRGDGAPPLAVVPLGTANVLAHELGLDFKAASLAQTITSGRAVLVHPGEASGGGDPRCFSLMAGAGFDAKVVAGVSARLKRRLGKAAYVWRSMIEARRYKPVRYAVEVDGVRYEAASVIVTRGRHYAGPYIVAPKAALGEPLLHVCLFERWGRSHTLRFGFALLMGWLPTAGGYRVVTGRDVRLSVMSDAGEVGGQPVQIDGDDALTLPVSISVASGAIRMMQPAKPLEKKMAVFPASLRAAVGLAGIAAVALFMGAAAHAADLGKDDEVAIRGEIVAADPVTRMIIVESPDRDTLSYRVLPTMGASSSGDTFKRLRPGVMVDLRYYRVVDMLVAKSSPEIDKQAATLVSDPAQGPGILGTNVRARLWALSGTVVRTDLAAKKMDIVHADGGMVYRTPWIKSAEGQAVLATLKPGDKVTLVFSERTAFEVTPIN